MTSKLKEINDEFHESKIAFEKLLKLINDVSVENYIIDYYKKKYNTITTTGNIYNELKNITDGAPDIIKALLNWEQSSYNTNIKSKLNANFEAITYFDNLIKDNKDLLNTTSDNTNKLLNNDLKNKNAKDELIYSIRSKYNMILSILLLILIIVSYLFYFKKLSSI